MSLHVVTLVNTTDVDMSKSAIAQWLHGLGFSYQHDTKGVYYDGHERKDIVVASRTAYLDILQTDNTRFSHPSNH